MTMMAGIRAMLSPLVGGAAAPAGPAGSEGKGDFAALVAQAQEVVVAAGAAPPPAAPALAGDGGEEAASMPAGDAASGPAQPVEVVQEAMAVPAEEVLPVDAVAQEAPAGGGTMGVAKDARPVRKAVADTPRGKAVSRSGSGAEMTDDAGAADQREADDAAPAEASRPASGDVMPGRPVDPAVVISAPPTPAPLPLPADAGGRVASSGSAPIADVPVPPMVAGTTFAASAIQSGVAEGAAMPMVKGEAMTLLQIVRAQQHRAASDPLVGADITAAASPDDDRSAPTSVGSAVPVAVSSASAATATPAMPPVAQNAAGPAVLTLPVADLSDSLGAQVIDMGVSGQWIDGLARDIAGIAANGAQGRFQIEANRLGTIEVDIRQGDGGAAISLTVASEAAEQALRQDSDRLRMDAGLSALRISDVRIERAPAPVDAPRGDMGGQGQPSGQPGAQQQGQGALAGQMHDRGQQQRENRTSGHKESRNAAVLNHERAGASAADMPRARYA